MKRSITIITTAIILVASLATACIKETEQTIEEIEQHSLKAWMEKYRPDLVDNYQTDGGYYVEVLDKGCLDSAAITGQDVWVWYDFTGRDLHNNIYETRKWEIAKQLGTYNDHTHYTPSFRFSGKESTTMMEGTYLATFNKLSVRDTESGELTELEVRYGTKLKLYLPSSIVQIEGDGGYEGQYTLDANKPMIVTMEVYGHVNNPVAYEGNYVDSFANINGGLCTEHKAKVEQETKSSYRRCTTRTEESDEEQVVDTRPLEFFDGRWHQPVDTMAHLYVNYSFTPESSHLDYNAIGIDTLMYPTQNSYSATNAYSSTMSDLDRRINAALVERFGKGITRDEVLEADSVSNKASAKIWYIGRFLDGFIFDTNIDEVTEILYGKVEQEGTALTFNGTEPTENEYILAWNYAMPTLRLGQWAAILTVSTYGYGINGVVGSTTSTTTGGNYDAYYDYLNYMNYMNSYYGYGYGNMYNNGYYGYTPYYYGYNYPTYEDTSVTITTTSTEIPAFTPLLFEVFVEE